jgi:hypothetical protein
MDFKVCDWKLHSPSYIVGNISLGCAKNPLGNLLSEYLSFKHA